MNHVHASSTCVILSFDSVWIFCFTDRSKFRASEMPQAFQYELIKKAYEQVCLFACFYWSERSAFVESPVTYTIMRVSLNFCFYGFRGN